MRKRIILSLIISYLAFGYVPSDTVKAKIAVLHKTGEIYNPLKTRDRLKAGEMLRIFVLPEKDCFVYTIHTGEKESFLLCKAKLSAGKDTLILPTPEDYYVFDEGGVKEKITILCSKNKIDEVEKLFKDSEIIKSDNWNSTEEKIIAMNKENLNESSDKPFPLAGNVSSVNSDFIESMQSFIGKDVLIRKYEIEIKK